MIVQPKPLDETKKGRFAVPQCCQECVYLGFEIEDYAVLPSYYYCDLNIWLPTKKQACKKQRKIKRKEAQG